MKKQRQEAILRGVKSGRVSTQSELVEMLAREGFEVSQTTVSRDLQELGLARGRGGDGSIRYGDPDSLKGDDEPDRAFGRMAPQFLLSAVPTGNMVVIKTTTGGAQGLAAALDAAGFKGIAGTVAGDDTILVVCSDGTNSKKMRGKLLSYTEGQR